MAEDPQPPVNPEPDPSPPPQPDPVPAITLAEFKQLVSRSAPFVDYAGESLCKLGAWIRRVAVTFAGFAQ